MTDRINPETPQEIVLILGMHRSGTSALARVLNLAGLRLPPDLLEPNQDNPRGFWEPKKIVKINDQLLKQTDRHWADPKPMPEGWAEQFRDTNGTSQIIETLCKQAMQTAGQDAGLVIKDPRFSRVFPAWRTALKQLEVEAVCLIACRNPLNVYRSLKARDRFELNHVLELWLSYMLEAEYSTRGMRRVVVHFDGLLTDWRKTLQVIRDTTNLRGMNISDSQAQQIDTFLNNDLRHHQLKLADLDDHTPLHVMVKATYELFARTDGLAAEEAFDELDRQRKRRWNESSPGDGGSGIIYQLPIWHVEQSWEFIANGDEQMALNALDTAIKMSHDVARFHFLRGNVLQKMGRLEAALEARRSAVQLDAKVPRFHRAFCNNLEQLGKYEEAADALGVLALLESSAATHHQHGNWLKRIGRFAEAVDAQGRAIALDATQRNFHVALANASVQLGNKEQACEALSRAIALGPANADLYDQLGQLLAGMDNWQEATSAFDKAVKIRCQLLGFRNTPVAASAIDEKVNIKAQLLQLVARLGSRYWADDLASQLQNTVSTECEQSDAWPLSRTIQARPFVPIIDHGTDKDDAAPLLSIMIPVYGIDNEIWLRVCLDSVLSQDLGPDWAEIVIVDDASGDKMIESVAKDYAPRVRYIQNQQNLGLVGNQNRCIFIARGAFVHILHQDDYVEQGFYQALLKPLLADDTLVAGFTHNRFIDSNGCALSNTDPPRPPLGVLEHWHITLSLDLRIQFPTIIVRKSSYQKAGGFFPGRKFSFDWDLWNHIAALGPVWYDPRPLAQYRIHESSASYGFSLKNRVVDLMQTVASMLQLLPRHLHRSTAEMGIYKFFRRYWGLVTAGSFQDISHDRSELVDFLLSGWTTDQERDQLMELLREFTD